MKPKIDSLVAKYIAIGTSLILLHSLLFIYLMREFEGREFSTITAVYWVISTMTTLGYGDIVFETDIGRIFSIIVQISGVMMFFAMVFPLIVTPWLERKIQVSLPTRVPKTMKNHVLICGYNALVETLIDELRARKTPSVLIDDDEQIVRRLSKDHVCIYGDPSDEEILKNANVDRAQFLIANMHDEENANIVLSASKLTDATIIALVEDMSIARYQECAGANRVLSPRQLLGTRIGQRAAVSLSDEVIGEELYRDLKIIEFPVYVDSPIAGKSLADIMIREKTGATIVGLWQGEQLILNPAPHTIIKEHSVLVVIGTEEQLNELMKLTSERRRREGHFIIAGFGDVGKRVAEMLEAKNIPYKIIDKKKIPGVNQVIGSSTDETTLTKAKIMDASTLIVTLNTDSENIYTTLMAREMNPHLKIISRANSERSIDKLYKAGADYVLSLSVVGGQMLAKIIVGEEEITLAEGFKVVRCPVSRLLVGKSIAQTKIRSRTGCTIIGIEHDERFIPNPDPSTIIPGGATLTLIGTLDQIQMFKSLF